MQIKKRLFMEWKTLQASQKKEKKSVLHYRIVQFSTLRVTALKF